MPDSQVVEELQLAARKAEIVQRGINGQQPSDIARDMGISRQYVMKMLDEALSDVTDLLLEKAERLHLINLLRIEDMMTVAIPLAKGGQPNPQYKSKEETPGVPEKLGPDRGWASTVKDLIKLEFDWEDRLFRRRDENPESGNQDIARPTITAGDEMYQLAQGNMEADWMQEYADMGADDLLPEGAPRHESDAIPIIPGQKIAEDRVRALLEAANIPVEDSESGGVRADVGGTGSRPEAGKTEDVPTVI